VHCIIISINTMQLVMLRLMSFTDMFTQDVQDAMGHIEKQNIAIPAPIVPSSASAQHVDIRKRLRQHVPKVSNNGIFCCICYCLSL